MPLSTAYTLLGRIQCIQKMYTCIKISQKFVDLENVCWTKNLVVFPDPHKDVSLKYCYCSCEFTIMYFNDEHFQNYSLNICLWHILLQYPLCYVSIGGYRDRYLAESTLCDMAPTMTFWQVPSDRFNLKVPGYLFILGDIFNWMINLFQPLTCGIYFTRNRNMSTLPITFQ